MTVRIARRGFIGACLAFAASCSRIAKNLTSPSDTTPLKTVLQKMGYVVEEHRTLGGGIELIVNGSKNWNFKIGVATIGIDPTRGIVPDNRPQTLDVANYPIPDDAKVSPIRF